FALVALIPVAARADDRAPALVSIQARLDGTTAVFDVRYRVELEGPAWRPYAVPLAAPRGGMIAAASVDGHALGLAPRDDAWDRFQELMSGEGGHPWAFWIGEGPDGLAMGYAAPKATTIELRVEVRAATCYERDARYVAIPKAWGKAQVVAPASC